MYPFGQVKRTISWTTHNDALRRAEWRSVTENLTYLFLAERRQIIPDVQMDATHIFKCPLTMARPLVSHPSTLSERIANEKLHRKPSPMEITQHE